MRRHLRTTAFLLATLATTSLPAELITIDFEGQPRKGSAGFSFQEDGFDVTATGQIIGIGNSTWFAPLGDGPDNGSNRYFYAFEAEGALTLSQTDGAAFSLTSFDGAELQEGLQSTWAERIDVLGTLSGGGTVSASFDLDWIQDGPGGEADFQTFILPDTFVGLSQVQFTGFANINSAERFSLDNIVLNNSSQPVPEPASMMLFGLGALGCLAVRRQTRKC